jgi:hypothetical protein
MLRLKHNHHLDLTHIIEELSPVHQLQFAAVSDDDDALTQAIASDDDEHDNKWQLSERPDPEELSRFWVKVESEVKNDPEWTFEDE